MRKSIKFLSTLVALMLVVSGFCVIPVSAADVHYSVSSAAGATGETVTVSVTMNSAIEIWGANVSLAYNSADLQVVSCAAGDAVVAGSSINDTGSAVNFSGMYSKTSGTVFTVSFKILKAEGKTGLTLSSSENTDDDGVVHEASATHSYVTVSNKVNVPAEKVTLDKTSITLKKGGTHKLKVTVTPENSTDKLVLFQSSDDNVATVSNDGVITAVAGGSATITVKVGSKTATCKVNVSVPQTGIKAYGNTTRTVEMGKTLKLAVVKVPADTSDNFKTTWTSSDTKIATVDANGTVTPVSEGVVKITAKSNNWSVVYTVTVGKGAAESTTAVESTTEMTESTTMDESTTVEESTTEMTQTTVPFVTMPTTEDFSLLEPTSNENIQENNNNNNQSYIYIIILATAGVVTVVAGAVTYFVTKGYYGTKKKQKIVVEEKHRG